MRSIDPGAIRESKCLVIEPTSELACLLVVVAPSSTVSRRHPLMHLFVCPFSGSFGWLCSLISSPPSCMRDARRRRTTKGSNYGLASFLRLPFLISITSSPLWHQFAWWLTYLPLCRFDSLPPFVSISEYPVLIRWCVFWMPVLGVRPIDRDLAVFSFFVACSHESKITGINMRLWIARLCK